MMANGIFDNISLKELDVIREILAPKKVFKEDTISSLDVKDDEEPEEELSGHVEEIIINPEYKFGKSTR